MGNATQENVAETGQAAETVYRPGKERGYRGFLGYGSCKHTAGEDILSYPFLGLRVGKGQLMGEITNSECRWY